MTQATIRWDREDYSPDQSESVTKIKAQGISEARIYSAPQRSCGSTCVLRKICKHHIGVLSCSNMCHLKMSSEGRHERLTSRDKVESYVSTKYEKNNYTCDQHDGQTPKQHFISLGYSTTTHS